MATPRPGEPNTPAAIPSLQETGVEGWLSPGYVAALCQTDCVIITYTAGTIIRIAPNNPRRVGLLVGVNNNPNLTGRVMLMPDLTAGVLGLVTRGSPFLASLSTFYAAMIQEWWFVGNDDGFVTVCDMTRKGGS